MTWYKMLGVIMGSLLLVIVGLELVRTPDESSGEVDVAQIITITPEIKALLEDGVGKEIQRRLEAIAEGRRKEEQRESVLAKGREQLLPFHSLAKNPAIQRFLDADLGLFLFRMKTGKMIKDGINKGKENELWLLLRSDEEGPNIYWGSLAWGWSSWVRKVEDSEWLLYDLGSGKIQIDLKRVSKYIQEQLADGTYYKGYINP